MTALRVLISGAGVGGLTLACLLRQRGLDTVVIDKAGSWNRKGYVISLWPNGGSILQAIGALTRLRRIAKTISRYSVADSGGRIRRTAQLGVVVDNHGPVHQVHRADLHAILVETAVSHGIEVRCNTTVASIDNGRSCAAVEFSDGSRDEFDLVVGAEGTRSELRDRVLGPTPVRFFGATGWAFMVPDKFPVPDGILELWGDHCYFGLYPLADGRGGVYCGVRSARGVADPVERRIATLRRRFADFGGPVPSLLASLTDAEQIYHNDLLEVVLDRWHLGRVVLLGDAAHAIVPFSGMGASLAMEDAFVLAEELTRASSSLLGRALASYERRRRSRVTAVRTRTERKGRAMFGGRLMPFGLRTLAGVMPLPFAVRGRHTVQEWLIDEFLGQPL